MKYLIVELVNQVVVYETEDLEEAIAKREQLEQRNWTLEYKVVYYNPYKIH